MPLRPHPPGVYMILHFTVLLAGPHCWAPTIHCSPLLVHQGVSVSGRKLGLPAAQSRPHGMLMIIR